MLKLQGINLRRGPNLLLEEADLTVRPGQKMTITGKNGCGKSSLFALILGEIVLERGDIDIPAHWKVTHLSQELPTTEQSALEYVLDGHKQLREVEIKIAEATEKNDGNALARLYMQYEELGGYTASANAAQLLTGLGFSQDQHQLPVNAFSGGWRMRLNLAKLLIQPSDLMLLDEPTNHLDMDAIIWLEKWLRAYTGTLLLISHDRDFMDAVVDSVAHIENNKINSYTGNYSAFEEQRAARLILQQSVFEKQERRRSHLQHFIDRFGAKASKARQAQSRFKQLQRMQLVAAVQADSPFEFAFRLASRIPNPLLTLEKVDIGYDAKRILEKVNFDIRLDQRIGLLGPNGAGKSTLMKVLADKLAPLQGERQEGQHLKIGYFEQHQLEQLSLDYSPLWHLQMLDKKASVQELRNFLGGFDFRGDKALAPVRPFSGGEKARLVLAMLVWQRPNLLLLDEPTNHLDLEMREALTTALQEFEGAMLVVSHDRHLLRLVCDELWLVDDGEVKLFDGDMDDYLKWLEQQNQKREKSAKEKVSSPLSQQQKTEIQKNLQILEKQILQAEKQLQKIREELANPNLYTDNAQQGKLIELHQREKKIAEELTMHEKNWLDLQEML